MGGGIYVSMFPIEFTLKNAVVTNNNATNLLGAVIAQYPAGYGGGYWHCPSGNSNLNIEDGNYYFDNNSMYGGEDIHLLKKNMSDILRYSSPMNSTELLSPQSRFNLYEDGVKFLIGARVVSYTHLDVYKRQCMSLSSPCLQVISKTSRTVL